MSFASLSYLVFLPIVWGVYWLLQRRHGLQNLFLLVASYVFYGWLDWRIVPLFFCISLIAYGAAIGIERERDTAKRKGFLGCAVFLILANLAIFKYFNFFAESIGWFLNAIGLHCDVPTLHLVLPIGISFYTFQALGYVIDVYYQRQKPTHDVIAFLTFISFFPQLVAGPIERAKDLLPQIERRRTVNYQTLVGGSRLILWGFFKKVVIADNCALAVNEAWEAYARLSGPTLVVAAVLFSFQIYCDFSGYSDIAIGTARLFGIRLSQNFAYPYYSTGVADFWRRWNMTLMSWFRDYIYIPLGGNRCGKWKRLRNTWTVFLISGLWHGANWTFVLWGAYNALLLIPHTLFRQAKLKLPIPNWMKIAGTFMLITFGWILFRAPSLSDAWSFTSRLLVPGTLSKGKVALAYCAGFVILEWLVKNHTREPLSKVWSFKPCRLVAYYLLLMAIVLLRGEEQMFIYFQF